jgi:2-polyprenyl-6-methoxyphenol hydroxylase-like FAD-dependent oxidoreductase
MLSNQKIYVVGAGPAGLVAAIALRRDGHDVTIVDRAIPPIDKACGEGLLPESLAALGELGIQIPADVGFAFRGIRFTDASSSVAGDFPNGAGRGVRRTVLHQILVESAIRLGISTIWNAKYVGLADRGISVNHQFIEAQLVVGADGQKSQIRQQAGLGNVTSEKRRYGFRQHFRLSPWSSYVELYWGKKSQIYITPIAADEICVAVVSRNPHLRLANVLDDFPELKRKLSTAVPLSTEMGALSVSRKLRRVQQNRIVLIGDASGSVDAVTGEGMCLAFKQALALSAAVKSGRIHEYQQRHRALMKRPHMMASLMLALERNSQLQRRALAGLSRHPEIFESLLAFHVGASSLRDLCSWRLLNFGRAFLDA